MADEEAPDYIILDDPLKDGESGVGWFDKTLSMRGLASGSTPILVMSRISDEDIPPSETQKKLTDSQK